MVTPSPRLVLAVAAGGAVGSAARYGVTVGLDPLDAVPWGTLTVNLLGSLLLGIVVSAIASPTWRLALGTGALGGFTTYGALAVQTHDLLASEPRLAVGYAVATLAGGWLLALVGLALGRWWAQGSTQGRAS